MPGRVALSSGELEIDAILGLTNQKNAFPLGRYSPLPEPQA